MHGCFSHATCIHYGSCLKERLALHVLVLHVHKSHASKCLLNDTERSACLGHRCGIGKEMFDGNLGRAGATPEVCVGSAVGVGGGLGGICRSVNQNDCMKTNLTQCQQ